MKDLEHSLLQKAVRRGHIDTVEKVVNYLLCQGYLNWLRKRLPVMILEECWTMDNQLTSGNLLDQYINLALTVKNKDAAGLASLAVNYHEGDWKALRGNLEQRKAIASLKKTSTVDKAMIYAAEYFIEQKIVPRTAQTQPQNNPNFPYWIAFDKHTEIGRIIISDACNRINIDTYLGLILAFYLEGSLCNQMTISPYWQLAREYQINKLKITFTQAQIIWEKLKAIIIELTKEKADELKERIEKPKISHNGNQLVLI